MASYLWKNDPPSPLGGPPFFLGGKQGNAEAEFTLNSRICSRSGTDEVSLGGVRRDYAL
jgi:hypothetical protein